METMQVNSMWKEWAVRDGSNDGTDENMQDNPS